MICFYHAGDFDGKCSAAIVQQAYKDVKLVGVDYGNPFAFDLINPGEEVFLVDFSLPFTDQGMLRLNEVSKLNWIDHHKTALDEAHAKGFLASKGQLLSVKRAACELTWEYLFHDKPVPYAVTLFGRYDVWDHEDYPDALPFQYGARAHGLSVQDGPFSSERLWSLLFSDTDWLVGGHQFGVSHLISLGTTILKYQEQMNETTAKKYAFTSMWGSLHCLCINAPAGGSKLLESIYDENNHHLMIVFCYAGAKRGWGFGLYSSRGDIDCSEIAKRYGGGGHKGAAGFFDLSGKVVQDILQGDLNHE